MKRPLSDAELNEYFKVYDDFNAQYDGVSLSDFNQCRAMINSKVRLRRVGGKILKT